MFQLINPSIPLFKKKSSFNSCCISISIRINWLNVGVFSQLLQCRHKFSIAILQMLLTLALSRHIGSERLYQIKENIKI